MKIKQPQFLQKIDRYLLLNRPSLWLLKIHWALLFSALMLLFAELLALCLPNHLNMEIREPVAYVNGLRSISGLFSIFWLIHVVRGFRSVRRHMSMWLCSLILIVMNMSYVPFWFTYYHITYNLVSRSELAEDMVVLTALTNSKYAWIDGNEHMYERYKGRLYSYIINLTGMRRIEVDEKVLEITPDISKAERLALKYGFHGAPAHFLADYIDEHNRLMNGLPEKVYKLERLDEAVFNMIELYWCGEYLRLSWIHFNEISHKIFLFLFFVPIASYFVRLFQTHDLPDAVIIVSAMTSIIVSVHVYTGDNIDMKLPSGNTPSMSVVPALISIVIIFAHRLFPKRVQRCLITCISLTPILFYLVFMEFELDKKIFEFENNSDLFWLIIFLYLAHFLDIYACRLLTKLHKNKYTRYRR